MSVPTSQQGRAESSQDAVLAWYGCAVASYQPIEDILALLFLLSPGTETSPTSGALNFLAGVLTTETLGDLLNRLVEGGTVARSSADELRRAFDRRNELVHRYLRTPTRQRRMATEAGRTELVAELRRWVADARALGHGLAIGIPLMAASRASVDDLAKRLAASSGERRQSARLGRLLRTLLVRRPSVTIFEAIETMFPPEPSHAASATIHG